MTVRGGTAWNKMDLTGQVFGRWTVIRRIQKGALSYWLCKCACGNEKDVCQGSLTNGKSTSCGKGVCHRLYAHGNGITGCRSPEYLAWSNMKARCSNPNFPQYHDYGGRGIQTCAEWKTSFERFLEDMGPRPSEKHTLERIDVNGGYSPSNCCWATWDVQAMNKRRRAGRYTYKKKAA